MVYDKYFIMSRQYTISLNVYIPILLYSTSYQYLHFLFRLFLHICYYYFILSWTLGLVYKVFFICIYLERYYIVHTYSSDEMINFFLKILFYFYSYFYSQICRSTAVIFMTPTTNVHTIFIDGLLIIFFISFTMYTYVFILIKLHISLKSI